MKTATRPTPVTNSSYLVGVLTVAGVGAILCSILIAWPALAYIGSKLI